MWLGPLSPPISLHSTFPITLPLASLLFILYAPGRLNSPNQGPWPLIPQTPTLPGTLSRSLHPSVFGLHITFLGCLGKISPKGSIHNPLFLLSIKETARRSNQSNLKEISPEYSLEGLKLKLHYFGHLIWRTDSLEKTLMLGKIKVGGEGDDRGWDGWMASPMQWTWVWVYSRSRWWTGRPGMLQSMEVAKNWTRLSDWTELNQREFWNWQPCNFCLASSFTPKGRQRFKSIHTTKSWGAWEKKNLRVK